MLPLFRRTKVQTLVVYTCWFLARIKGRNYSFPGLPPGQACSAPPKGVTIAPTQPVTAALESIPVQDVEEHLKVQLLIRSYQVFHKYKYFRVLIFVLSYKKLCEKYVQTRGHNTADLDPLGINSVDLTDTSPAELDPAFYGLQETDMEKEFLLPMSTFIGGDKKSLKLRDIISRLKVIPSFGIRNVQLSFLGKKWIFSLCFLTLLLRLLHFRKFIVHIWELNICI